MKTPKTKNEVKVGTTLRDTLYNMHQSSGASDEYRKGIIVGVIGGLMACEGIAFDHAVHVACFHMADHGVRMIVPESWLVTFGTKMTQLGKTYILPV